MPLTYDFRPFTVVFPSDGVAILETGRPEALNAFTSEMIITYGKVIDQLAVDPDCRAIIITAAGDKAFSAGLDLKGSTLLSVEGQTDGARKMIRDIRRPLQDLQAAMSSAEKCLKPIITVLHGYSFGLAIDLASATDIRLCTTDAKMSVKEVDIGLAADIGSLSRLPKIVGSLSWVKDICFSARIFTAEEALQQGFVSDVFKNKKDALDAALKLASLIASKSPVAVQSTKELINFSIDHSTESGLRYTAAWNSGALQTADVPAAVQASLTRSNPRFEKL